VSRPVRTVTVLAVHPVSTAATRLRAAQYERFLTDAGLTLRIWTFFDEPGVRRWFGPRHRDRVAAALRALVQLPRAVAAVRGADAIIVQREALPFGPPVLELLSGWRRTLIWDIDDALWESYASSTTGRVSRLLKATGDKYRRICRRADEVWAGSEVLAAWCRQHNENVEVVPTVVPVPPMPDSPAMERTISWIGSHSTGAFVEAVLPVMASIEPPAEILVVGASPRLPASGSVTVLPWSLDEEARTLARTRVGLYPVDRSHPLADGKCGLKAILYMSRGIPCVVTPTTTNAAVLRDGKEGFHASDPYEWGNRVARLLDDDALWSTMSKAAHARAEAEYSLERWGPRQAARLRAILDGAH
jgi:glycosyltransferase involved in cell wall biosynthesis